jgi:hypothetical protein
LRLGQQVAVVVGKPPGQRLDELKSLDAHPSAGHVGQHHRVPLAGDQGGQHRPPGDPEQVRGHHVELGPGVLEQFLDALLRRGPHPNLVDPVPGQVP